LITAISSIGLLEKLNKQAVNGFICKTADETVARNCKKKI